MGSWRTCGSWQTKAGMNDHLHIESIQARRTTIYSHFSPGRHLPHRFGLLCEEETKSFLDGYPLPWVGIGWRESGRMSRLGGFPTWWNFLEKKNKYEYFFNSSMMKHLYKKSNISFLLATHTLINDYTYMYLVLGYVYTRVSTVIRTLQNGSVSALGRFNLSGTG